MVCILLAEAAITAATPLLLWAAAFFAVLAVVIRGWEEPHLKTRYGDEYVDYRRNVPAWIPRLSAWNPVGSGRDMRSRLNMWVRWVNLQGVPRAFLGVQARRGDPLARLLVGPQRGGDPYPAPSVLSTSGHYLG